MSSPRERRGELLLKNRWFQALGGAAAALAGLMLMSAAPARSPEKAAVRPGKPVGVGKSLHIEGTAGTFSPADHQCNHFGTLACPSSSLAGALTSADCRLDDQSFVDLVQFAGAAGQTVTIDMTSEAFDTYLFLLDATPAVVAQNDDFGGGTNSRIVFTLPASGTWTIGATSFLPSQLGTYSLTLQCSTAPAPTPTPTVTPPATPTPVPGPCVPDAATLCLNNGRFRVQANFSTPQGQAGAAAAVPETGDTGMFWFFSASNIEVIVKVVDGCSFNSHYWVFAGGLTNVQVVITVTDTARGAIRTYTNPQGAAFAPIQATDAFATCP